MSLIGKAFSYPKSLQEKASPIQGNTEPVSNCGNQYTSRVPIHGMLIASTTTYGQFLSINKLAYPLPDPVPDT